MPKLVLTDDECHNEFRIEVRLGYNEVAVLDYHPYGHTLVDLQGKKTISQLLFDLSLIVQAIEEVQNLAKTTDFLDLEVDSDDGPEAA